ncbi:biotin/lipoyl-containing protein [Tessaracoccus sp. OH4464_COT-324]|uniref:biotin/lipoyl-containing protein n=1 Tax=Tessaracoccus sp. OH4464_COT-324 TaxID=2491059 RepID=UPI000F64487A|nr:acetyl-CoA carboxylase biotin carboxyl carrier protein subunit [Tessaracoccus sp. OH4464_COT-324]RRD46764.1 acetyl-CoA carboxylase biotin carboxyl carrier protein subunit [Tessaracoccus sp. OH4464_COT-324]
MKLKVTVDKTEYEIEVEVMEEERQGLGPVVIGVNAGSNPIPTKASMPAASASAIVAPLAGSVSRILVEEGQDVEAGTVVLVLEAMKMETEITAPKSGKVESILVSPGEAVQGGQPLIGMAD